MVGSYCLAPLPILMLFASLTLKAGPSAKEQLQESNQYFDKGHYKKALELLKSLDIRKDFDSSDDMKLAFKIRAIAYDQTNNISKASETIKEIFFLDPDYTFNPFDTPKSVVALAQQIKKIIEEKNQRLASIKSEAKEHRVENPPILAPLVKEKIVLIEKKPHMLTSLFPLGINHFYLGSPMKGGIYMSLQTLGLATNIAAFWWKQSYLDSYGITRLKEKNLANHFEITQLIQYIALGSAAFIYGASVIDAMLNFR
jgi:hypothetical protein